MARILGVKDVPTAVARIYRKEAVCQSVLSGDVAVILGPAAKYERVVLGHIHVIEHRDGQTGAAIGPGGAAVLTHVQAAVVCVIYPSGRAGGHQQGMMVGMSIRRIT